jgi:hypothetical protein
MEPTKKGSDAFRDMLVWYEEGSKYERLPDETYDEFNKKATCFGRKEKPAKKGLDAFCDMLDRCKEMYKEMQKYGRLPFEEETPDETDIEAARFDRKEFDRLLIKTDLEAHANDLWNLGILLRCATNRYNKSKTIDAERRAYFIELTKALLLLMENDKIRISSTMSSVNISDARNINVIKDSMLSAFKENGLNESPISYERGKDLLNSGQCDDWVIDVLREWYGYSMSYDEVPPFTKNDIDDDMIEFFIMENTETIENIDIDFLRQKLDELETPKAKGAPGKNYPLVCLLKEILPLLHRLPTNSDYRLIFDYCMFFDMIDKGITSAQQSVKSVFNVYKYAIKLSGI